MWQTTLVNLSLKILYTITYKLLNVLIWSFGNGIDQYDMFEIFNTIQITLHENAGVTHTYQSLLADDPKFHYQFQKQKVQAWNIGKTNTQIGCQIFLPRLSFIYCLLCLYTCETFLSTSPLNGNLETDWKMMNIDKGRSKTISVITEVDGGICCQLHIHSSPFTIDKLSMTMFFDTIGGIQRVETFQIQPKWKIYHH